MIKQKTLTELSKEKKIDQFSVLREILQISFLNQLYQQTKSKDIYFKGGTCLKLLYNSNRFSEDLVFSTTLEKKIIDQITTIAISKLKKEYPLISIKDEQQTAINNTLRFFSKRKMSLSTKQNNLNRHACIICFSNKVYGSKRNTSRKIQSHYDTN